MDEKREKKPNIFSTTAAPAQDDNLASLVKDATAQNIQQWLSNSTVERQNYIGTGINAASTVRNESQHALRANSVLNLKVKVLTQALGVENQWVERGDGRVEFNDLTICVVALRDEEDERVNRVSTAGEATQLSSSIPSSLSDEKNAVAGSSDENKATNVARTMDDKICSKSKEESSKINRRGRKTAKQKEPSISASTGLQMTSTETAKLNCSSDASTTLENKNDVVEKYVVILEDTITNETPLVGENCCIVWNSFEQQLSFCLMFATEEGYAASWSALAMLQDRVYPPLHVDLLRRCRPLSHSNGTGDSSGIDSDNKDSSMSSLFECGGKFTTLKSPPGVLPYSFYIHNEYHPPLGCIERHALSLCIMEYGHFTRSELYAQKSTIFSLLELANVDLMEQLLSDESFPLLLKGLDSTVEPKGWSVPDGLATLTIPEELAILVTKDLRVAHLQEKVLSPSSSTDLLLKLSVITHRLRNELVCALLANDGMLKQATEALMITPPLPMVSVSKRANNLSHNSQNHATTKADSSAVEACRQTEQQVIAHLRFFRSLVTVSITELGRDLVEPVVVKIFQNNLLKALSLVAERFAMPSGVALVFLNSIQENEHDSSALRRGVCSSFSPPLNYYSEEIERELVWLLDVTITRLNERQEEQLINQIVRSPILADPTKYNGLLSFMVWQLVMGGAGASAQNGNCVMRDCLSTRNFLLFFHVLGLHDDEGNAAAERTTDPESTEIRNRFHYLVISKYLQLAVRGMLMSIPSPPHNRSGQNIPKNSPIVQFNNAPATQNLPQGISPALLRVLEYLINLANPENRDTLLKIIFSSKSRVLPFVEACFQTAAASVSSQRTICLDVLCGNVHLLKAIVTQLTIQESDLDYSTKISTHTNVCVAKNLFTTICSQLTVERDTLGIVLKAFHKIGGRRRNTIFHSAVLSLLNVVEKGSIRGAEEPEGGSVHDIRDYLFLKHLDIIPQRYAMRFREALLNGVCGRLSGAPSHTPNDSVSALSITGSDAMRSSSKLRFVDEVEAATGGIDGTVLPESISNLSPAMMASMYNTEDMFSKKLRGNIEQRGSISLSSQPNSSKWTNCGNSAGSAPSFSQENVLLTRVKLSHVPTTLSPLPQNCRSTVVPPSSNKYSMSANNDGCSTKPMSPLGEKPLNGCARFRSTMSDVMPYNVDSTHTSSNGEGAVPVVSANENRVSTKLSLSRSASVGSSTQAEVSLSNLSSASSSSDNESVLLPRIKKRPMALLGKR